MHSGNPLKLLSFKDLMLFLRNCPYPDMCQWNLHQNKYVSFQAMEICQTIAPKNEESFWIFSNKPPG